MNAQGRALRRDTCAVRGQQQSFAGQSFAGQGKRGY